MSRIYNRGICVSKTVKDENAGVERKAAKTSGHKTWSGLKRYQ